MAPSTVFRKDDRDQVDLMKRRFPKQCGLPTAPPSLYAPETTIATEKSDFSRVALFLEPLRRPLSDVVQEGNKFARNSLDRICVLMYTDAMQLERIFVELPRRTCAVFQKTVTVVSRAFDETVHFLKHGVNRAGERTRISGQFFGFLARRPA
jgi:hypothetical protein